MMMVQMLLIINDGSNPYDADRSPNWLSQMFEYGFIKLMNMHAMMIPLWNPDDSHPSDTYDTDYWLATSSLLSPIDDISNE